jgi:CRP/FNR family transcriptional regulator, cyclic AMP receptor protein
MLDVAAGLPEVELGPGEILVREGDQAGPIWILVSGALEVRKGDTPVNTISLPGALVGEISVLLGTAAAATVETTMRSRLLVAADGRELLEREPVVTRMVAIGLAERLNYVTRYLADLKEQYAGAPGLAMVPDVLSTLSERQEASASPGSARDPDPEY